MHIGIETYNFINMLPPADLFGWLVTSHCDSNMNILHFNVECIGYLFIMYLFMYLFSIMYFIYVAIYVLFSILSVYYLFSSFFIYLY